MNDQDDDQGGELLEPNDRYDRFIPHEPLLFSGVNMLRKLLSLAPFLLILSGCGFNHFDGPSTGWKFEMGRPGILRSSTPYQQNSGDLSAFSLPVAPQAPAPQTAPCALEQINAKLDALLSRMPRCP